MGLRMSLGASGSREVQRDQQGDGGHARKSRADVQSLCDPIRLIHPNHEGLSPVNAFRLRLVTGSRHYLSLDDAEAFIETLWT
jgi:hypothetical protein